MKGKTKELNTALLCVVDRSGSMASIAEDAIGGFNTFLAAQQKVKGHASLTLVLFDHEYLVPVEGVDIQKVKPLTEQTYVPRGSTALLDAVGRAVTTLKGNGGEKFDKVIVMILTDGYENASREWTYPKVGDLIAEMRKQHDWEFVFVGADVNAFDIAQHMNIPRAGTANFLKTKDGMLGTMSAVANYAASSRVGGMSVNSATVSANYMQTEVDDETKKATKTPKA